MRLDSINAPKSQVLQDVVYFNPHWYWFGRKVLAFFSFIFLQFALVCELSAILLDDFTIKNINMKQLLVMTADLKVTSDRK